MRERPILFSGDMVRAMLAGRKTQTRRAVKPQPEAEASKVHFKPEVCRYGQPGDRLWVRETFMHEPATYCYEASTEIPAVRAHTTYRADVDHPDMGRWTPAIHMPRKLCRLVLEVEAVRVERLKSISREDAAAEGVARRQQLSRAELRAALGFHQRRRRMGRKPVGLGRHLQEDLMQRYPLTWPDGWKRTLPNLRTRAKFHGTSRQYSSTPGGGSWLQKKSLSVADATGRTLDALRRFGVLDGDAIVSTNLVLRLDGLPRSDQREPQDPGVAVYWTRQGEGMKCMAIDLYDRVADNLAAIAATLEAMRAIERHGGAQILARAFTGFEALPAPGQTSAPGWRELLGFKPNDVVTPDLLDRNYRIARSRAHPDKEGGSNQMFDMVQKAYEIACQEIRA